LGIAPTGLQEHAIALASIQAQLDASYAALNDMQLAGDEERAAAEEALAAARRQTAAADDKRKVGC